MKHASERREARRDLGEANMRFVHVKPLQAAAETKYESRHLGDQTLVNRKGAVRGNALMPDRPDFINMNEERLMEYGNAVVAVPPFEAGTPEIRRGVLRKS